jgi:hypothetical protein
MSMIQRVANYWRVWRGRGAAKLDHRLWVYWAVFGRFPSPTDSAGRG